VQEDESAREDGWPTRDFDEGARGYLLVEARQRVQEQLALIRAQDVKIAALFTTSAGLFALSGALGSLKVDATPETVLTFLGFFASLLAWCLLGLAYWTREIGSGLDLLAIRANYRETSRQELEDVTLETLVSGFKLNQQTIRSKERWLRKSFFAVAAQLLLLFLAIIATAVAGPELSSPLTQSSPDSSASGAVLVDGER
jgi:hypothetical protein